MAQGLSLGERKEVGGKIRDFEGKEIDAETDEQVIGELEKYQKFIKDSGKEWKFKDGLAAMGIDVSWFVDDFVMDIIGKYLYYERAPHQAFEGPMERHPAIWVQSCAFLNQIFGVKF